MRWEQAKSMEKEIGSKRNRAGEEKEGRRWEGKNSETILMVPKIYVLSKQMKMIKNQLKNCHFYSC